MDLVDSLEVGVLVECAEEGPCRADEVGVFVK